MCPRLEPLAPFPTDPPTAVWRIGPNAVAFRTALAADADGAPDAYNPTNTGLDHICNAGVPKKPNGERLGMGEPRWVQRCLAAVAQARRSGFETGVTVRAHDVTTDFEWWGIATDAQGRPVVQGPRDPSPGSFVSTTALTVPDRSPSSPARYIDAATVPYFVLPRAPRGSLAGLALGDVAMVLDPTTRTVVYAIAADIGPRHALGEGSIALIRALGVEPVVDGRVRRGLDRPVWTVALTDSRPADITDPATFAAPPAARGWHPQDLLDCLEPHETRSGD